MTHAHCHGDCIRDSQLSRLHTCTSSMLTPAVDITTRLCTPLNPLTPPDPPPPPTPLITSVHDVTL